MFLKCYISNQILRQHLSSFPLTKSPQIYQQAPSLPPSKYLYLDTSLTLQSLRLQQCPPNWFHQNPRDPSKPFISHYAKGNITKWKFDQVFSLKSSPLFIRSCMFWLLPEALATPIRLSFTASSPAMVGGLLSVATMHCILSSLHTGGTLCLYLLPSFPNVKIPMHSLGKTHSSKTPVFFSGLSKLRITYWQVYVSHPSNLDCKSPGRKVHNEKDYDLNP